jgi:predicted NBD/HSP70 family sugar kinase
MGADTNFSAVRSNDQSSLRGRNAKLILSLLRRNGTMPSAEIARTTGLSAQTVSNIIRAFEADDILTRGEAVKGKVGKPSVPVSLNPEGARSFGLSIGRRAAELVLVDFMGREIARRSLAYDYPTTDRVSSFLERAMREILDEAKGIGSTTVGCGVAAPFGLWNWLDHVGAPGAEMDQWKQLDVQQWIGSETGLPTIAANDATSACVAEHLLGHGNAISDFAYIFMGAFVGGGLVIDGQVSHGPTGNSGAFGPMLVPAHGGGVTQLLEVASLYALERELFASAADISWLRSDEAAWESHDAEVCRWIEATAPFLAMAAISASSVVEVEAVVIDGAMPIAYRDRLVDAVSGSVEELPTTGIEPPRILAGMVGRSARSVGAALLPINARFFAS